jgi:glutathione S-transferase
MTTDAAARMTMHWSPRSPFVRKVMIAAYELGLEPLIDRRRTVVAMTAPNEDLLLDNPAGKIPTLKLADGTVLTDSTVICEYFDWLAGGLRLLPAPGPARWAELTRHAITSGLLETLVLWHNERGKPAAAQTKAWIDAFGVKVTSTLDWFEHEVDAVARGQFGLAQITLGCALSYMDFRLGFLDWRNGHPKLAAWHRTFSARDSARATEAVDA